MRGDKIDRVLEEACSSILDYPDVTVPLENVNTLAFLGMLRAVRDEDRLNDFFSEVSKLPLVVEIQEKMRNRR